MFLLYTIKRKSNLIVRTFLSESKINQELIGGILPASMVSLRMSSEFSIKTKGEVYRVPIHLLCSRYSEWNRRVGLSAF